MLEFNLVSLSVLTSVIFAGILIFIIFYNHKKSAWNNLIIDKNNKFNLIEQELTITKQSLNEQKTISSINEEKIKKLVDETLDLNKQISSLQTSHDKLNQDYSNLQKDNQNLNQEIKEKEKIVTSKSIEISKLESTLTSEKKSFESLKNAKDTLTVNFEEISKKILQEKSEELTKENKNILEPITTDLNSFGSLIKDSFTQQAEDKGYLKQELKSLKNLNYTLNNTANNLTNALTYSNKTQGNWGETALAQVLEHSGLTKDINYFVQETLKDEDNKLFRPDVIVKLPENKNIIIDAKVSIKHYTDYVNETNTDKQKEHLQKHISSVKNHIKELSAQDYANKLPNGESLDFVLMFMPVESAYLCAIKENYNFFIEEYFSKKVIIVPPSNLIAMLKIINNIWKHENKNKNILKIGEAGKNIHTKLILCVKHLSSFNKDLIKICSNYINIINTLLHGKGNLMDQALKLEELGVNTKNKFDKSLMNDIENTETKLIEQTLQLEELCVKTQNKFDKSLMNNIENNN